MVVLSGQTIRGLQILSPFYERTKMGGMTFGLGPAGYDVRIAERLGVMPGEFFLASTVEHFAMPYNVIGFVHDKSTWARKGLAVQNTVIEPGWRGFLTLELTNHGLQFLDILEGMPIAQIVFHYLDADAETPYNGKYQDQAPGAQEAKLE